MENQELTKKILKDILKATMNKRYIFESDLYNSIISFMRINLVDILKYKLILTNKPENEYADLPKEIDYMLNGTITNIETGDIFDFDIYYFRGRNNEIYPIEFIIQ